MKYIFYDRKEKRKYTLLYSLKDAISQQDFVLLTYEIYLKRCGK